MKKLWRFVGVVAIVVIANFIHPNSHEVEQIKTSVTVESEPRAPSSITVTTEYPVPSSSSKHIEVSVEIGGSLLAFDILVKGGSSDDD